MEEYAWENRRNFDGSVPNIQMNLPEAGCVEIGFGWFTVRSHVSIKTCHSMTS
jgi:hypothetical protein